MTDNHITYTELSKQIASFAQQKMFANWDKDDPMTEHIDIRLGNVWEEYEEFAQAVDDWTHDPTNENLNAALYEAGDLINEILFTCGVMLGNKSMSRE